MGCKMDVLASMKTILIGRWQHRRMLGSPHSVDQLDSSHTCLNNPETSQKTSRMDSLGPSIDKRSREEGRDGREAVRDTQTGGRELGWRAVCQQSRAPKSGLQKWRGRMECVLTASGT